MSSTMTLLGLLLLAIGVLAWLALIALNERALSVAIGSCRDAGLQFLDASVALQSLRLRRLQGQLGWQVDYRFDVSQDGQQRRHGTIRFFRGALEWIEIPGAGEHGELWVSPRNSGQP
jgi:hypothetical protein